MSDQLEEEDFGVWLRRFCSEMDLELKVCDGGLYLITNKKIAFQYRSVGESTENFIFQFLGEIDSTAQIQLVHVWEDYWKRTPELISERIAALLGFSKRIHGRSTQVKRLDKKTATHFLNENHLNRSVSLRYQYGLFHRGELVALAGFGIGRNMPNRGEGYRSYELIRFANLKGHTVVGGFSKLLKAFIESVFPSDIMTYVDVEWSTGRTYEQFGFRSEGQTPPIFFWVKPGDWIRYLVGAVPEHFLEEQGYMLSEEEQMPHLGYQKIRNEGNFKYRLVIS